MSGPAENVTHLSPGSGGAGFQLSPSQISCLLLGLTLATGMEFYTFESVNLVLPDMTGTLGVSFDEASWILTVYSSFLFLGVPLSVWLAGHFGYKRFLMWTTVLFAVLSVGITLSPTFKVMLVLRALQGLAGAGLTVWWRAGVYVIMPRPKRSQSLMRISTGLYLASAAGLLLSGFLTDRFSWRLICIPNIVLAVFSLLLLKRGFPDLPKSESQRLQQTDKAGLILLAIGILSLQTILSRGHIDDWFESMHIRVLAVVSAAALISFIHWQRSDDNRYPLLDVSLLKNRNVVAAVFIGLFTGMILSGSLFVLPEFLRLVDSQTHSATQTGRLLAFYALTAAALRPLMSKFIAKYGQRKAVAVAMCMLISSMLLLYRWLTSSTSDSYFLLPLALYACCLTMLLPSLGSGTVGKLDQHDLLDGMSLYMTFRQLGASLGVASLTILIENRETLHSSRLYEHLNLANENTATMMHSVSGYLGSNSGMNAAAGAHQSIALLSRMGAHQVEVLSYADCFLFMALIGTLALFLIPLIAPTVPAQLPAAPKASVPGRE
jgi:MFS transporter, DHA2 family, multidrug resistance protein